MSHVIVTGAAGFVGRVLVRRLLRQGLASRPLTRLTLIDRQTDEEPPSDDRVRWLTGSLHDPVLRASALARPVDAVFHLASLPGGAAERDYEEGRRINLDATLGLLEDLGRESGTPRFVFASSVAVYGEHLPEVVDEDTPPAPGLSYATHKLIGEQLVADASRRGWVDGCSLRLPGVVARPGDGAGLHSAFMSLLFWHLRDGRPLTVPVSPAATVWWMSVGTCVDNLLHAATLDMARGDTQRVYQMPVLRLRVSEVVAALLARFGEDRAACLRHAPDAFVERMFGSLPVLRTPRAEALGFRHDGDAGRLVERALAGD